MLKACVDLNLMRIYVAEGSKLMRLAKTSLGFLPFFMVTVFWTFRCDSCAMLCNVTSPPGRPTEGSRRLQGAGGQVTAPAPPALGSGYQGAGARIATGAGGSTVALLALLQHPVATGGAHPVYW